MGQTIKNLSKGTLTGNTIFPNRFVAEVCELFHVHYKNLRLVLSSHDWVEVAEGFKDALERWKKRGSPSPSNKRHIELCRKKVITDDQSKEILVNLNQNLYPQHEGMIFSEGAEFDEPQYIHLKIGDVRVELSITQFLEVADVIKGARERLESSSFIPELRETSVLTEE